MGLRTAQARGTRCSATHAQRGPCPTGHGTLCASILLVGVGDVFGVGGVEGGEGGVVENLVAADFSEVVPEPIRGYGSPAALGGGEEGGVYAEPGGEGEGAGELVVVFSDFCDGGAAADDGHDAFVFVEEGWVGFVVEGVCDVVGGVFALLLGDGGELGRGLLSAPVDVGHVAEDVDVGEIIEGEVGVDVDAAALAGGDVEFGGEGVGLEAAGPDDGAGGDGGAVCEDDVGCGDFFDGGAKVELDVAVLEGVDGIGLGFFGEVGDGGGIFFDEVDAELW